MNEKITAQDVVCKNHNARTEKDMYRICPAKLSKHELEDLYFTLSESNLGLKKTVNNQKDKIRELSTKVQRMTAAQRSSLSKEQKDCCAVTKAVCNEQKVVITDLKKTNERLSERIKLLNMKLCSAKQFLQRNSLQSTSKCQKYSLTNVSSLKNSSSSALHSKKTDSNLKSKAVSCQCLVNNIDANSTRAVQTDTKELELTPTRSVEVETEIFIQESNDSMKLFDGNKCRTQMNELKQRIFSLQEEVSKSRESYAARVKKLDSVISELRDGNARARSERVASEHALLEKEKALQDVSDRLRRAEAQYMDLSMQLSIEKRKVTELETSVKSAQMSNTLMKTIEEHLVSKQAKLASLKDNILLKSTRTSDWEESSPRLIVHSSPSMDLDKDATKISKYSDDSGYTETLNRSEGAGDGKEQNPYRRNFNENLVERIDNLQEQLDHVKNNIVMKDMLVNLKKPSTDLVKSRLSEDVLETYDEAAGCSKFCNDIPKNTLEIKFEDASTNSFKREKISNIRSCVVKGNSDSRIQIPSPLTVDTNRDPKLKKTNSKRLSNVDKFIRNYYNRKNISNKDSYAEKVSIDIDSCNKQSGTITKEDSPRRNKNDINKQPPDVFLNINHIENNPLKVRDKIGDTLNSDVLSNVDELTQNKDFEMKDSKNIFVGISSKDDDSNGKCTRKVHLGTSSKDGKNLKETKQNDLNPLSAKAEGDSIDVMNKSMRDSPTKADICFGQNTTEKGKLENTNRNQLNEDDLRRELCIKSHKKESRQKTLDCGIQYEVSDVKELGTQKDSQLPKKNIQDLRQTSQCSPRTYTVQEGAQVMDHDTDCEISSMTDLPSENEKTPREIYSPGENKLTTTYTDSYTSPYEMSYRSLSEGELPGYGAASLNKLSQGEKPMTSDQKTQEASSSLRMEETLQAIAEELARCKQLILSQRTKEVNFLTRFS